MGTIARSSNIKSKLKLKQKCVFDAQAFLDSAGVARKVRESKRAGVLYSQGDPATSVMYTQKGVVKLTVVNEVGKEAVVAIMRPGDFFGEGCLAGQPVRIGTASATTPCTVLVIEKAQMLKVLHEQHAFSDRFINFVLARNIRIEEDLIDQLFNSSEKRLARTLLLLAPQSIAGNAGRDGRYNTVTGQLLHEQIQETGFHQIQRQSSGQHLSLECRPTRVSQLAGKATYRKLSGFPLGGLDSGKLPVNVWFLSRSA